VYVISLIPHLTHFIRIQIFRVLLFLNQSFILNSVSVFTVSAAVPDNAAVIPERLTSLFHLRVVGINVESLLKSFSEQIGRQAAKIPSFLRISWDKISRNFPATSDTVATFHQIVFRKKHKQLSSSAVAVSSWVHYQKE
jgi:hypothetical protein